MPDAGDNGDPKRSDKYSIYLAAVEPNLREAAKEIMAQEAELPRRSGS